MRKIKRWLNDIFKPEDLNGIDMGTIGSALSDSSVRIIWLSNCLEEIKAINLEVDKRLLSGTENNLIDLCARRKAYQDILESILSARRQVVSQDPRPNLPSKGSINLDRVTA